MIDLPWYPWSNEYREDEWFLTLTMGQRWAWVALLSRANETAWSIPDHLLRVTDVTARVIQCDESDLRVLIESAKCAKKLIQQPDGDWLVVAGDKYRQQKQKREAANRQQKHRDAALRVTDVTKSNSTPHHTTPHHKTEKESTLSHICENDDRVKIENAVAQWNLFAERAGLPIVNVEMLLKNKTRVSHASARLEQFSMTDMIAAIQNSPHHMGKNDSGWKISWDWIMSSKTKMEALMDKHLTAGKRSLVRE